MKAMEIRTRLMEFGGDSILREDHVRILLALPDQSLETLARIIAEVVPPENIDYVTQAGPEPTRDCPTECPVRQEGDEMVCPDCGLRWDYSEEFPGKII